MGYSSKRQIQNRIAQSLLTGVPGSIGTPVDLLKIGTVLDGNVVKDEQVDQYIAWADQHINATLNMLYLTPFQHVADLQVCTFANIDQTNKYIATQVPVGLNVGDQIELIWNGQIQHHIIAQIVDPVIRNIFSTLDPISGDFPAGTRLLRLKYPQPLGFISASNAAAMIYDRHFSAQSDVNSSKFAIYLRSQSQQMLNNILQGRTILHGARRRGRSGYNPNLLDRYGIGDSGYGSFSADKTGGA